LGDALEAREMKRKDAEVIVVGAGPAGAALALQLARRGRDVLVLEGARFPRDKPCGDCVNPGAVGELERLGIAEGLRHELQPKALEGWRIEAPDGAFFQAAFGDGRAGWSVRRRDFDAALLARASSAGACVRFGRRVIDLVVEEGRVAGVVVREGSAGGQLRAAFVVGADGLRSVVQRRLGLAARGPRLRKIAVVGHLASPNGSGNYGELRVRGGRSCGYAPFASGGNVTLVIPGAEAGGMGGDARAFLMTALDDFPAVKSHVASAGLDDEVLVTGPFDRPVRRPWAPGAALVGDAAGYYDPFTGQGIHQALRSAALAAPAIDVALSDTAAEAAALKRYARALRRELAPTRALQRVIEVAIGRPQIMSRFVRGLAREEKTAARVLRATGDVAHPGTLLVPTFWVRLAVAVVRDRR
jgi:flavin-dependent dehydrogenase